MINPGGQKHHLTLRAQGYHRPNQWSASHIHVKEQARIVETTMGPGVVARNGAKQPSRLHTYGAQRPQIVYPVPNTQYLYG